MTRGVPATDERCSNGHPWTAKTRYVRWGGTFGCRTCQREGYYRRRYGPPESVRAVQSVLTCPGDEVVHLGQRHTVTEVLRVSGGVVLTLDESLALPLDAGADVALVVRRR